MISTYKGVSGYIYSAEAITDSGFAVQIPDAATSSVAVKVKDVEYVPDAYEAILLAEREGLITILRYDVFCKSLFPKIADKNGESCISILEKIAGCSGSFPGRCMNSTADISL